MPVEMTTAHAAPSSRRPTISPTPPVDAMSSAAWSTTDAGSIPTRTSATCASVVAPANADSSRPISVDSWTGLTAPSVAAARASSSAAAVASVGAISPATTLCLTMPAISNALMSAQ